MKAMSRKETLKTRELLEAKEMNVLVKIVDKTKIDRVRSKITQVILRYPTY
jgi:hypothetical protein